MTNQESRAEFDKALNELVTRIQKSAQKKFEYNLNTNVPKEILNINECAENAIEHGIIHSINSDNHWDTDKAISFAANLLEDVNCHDLAKYLRQSP